MKQPGLILLCGRNSRSTAYVQALAHAGIEPAAVIIYGTESSKINTERALKPFVQNEAQHETLFCPDVTIPVQQYISELGWHFCECASRELDSDELLLQLKQLAPEVLVYSGYGGQLVPDVILNQCPVLHIHSGALPQYRGSTTLYYEILEHGACAASAILLSQQIDTGPVVQVCHYPMPPPTIDVDYLYDNQIRADLLVKVLTFRHQYGHLPVPEAQMTEMPPYFIIHPVLKHLALLAVDDRAN
uniref:formyltransferase family protein n=1 Tax=Shewanella baltica TaxID=62322 RepID=UPI004048DFB9